MRRLSVMHPARLLRSNVDRQLSRNGRSGETGAVAMLIAILFGTGVLLGLAAITIDTGALLYERRQLQTGADAAALSIAQTCMNADRASTLCAAPNLLPSSTLVGLAGANAADQRSDIASVCGSPALVAANSIAFPTQCSTSPDPSLIQCPYTSSAAKYVEVRTSTRSGDGSSTILPPFLAQTLAGGNYSGETVKACARAAWGPAAIGAPIIPFTPSLCDWYLATANGTFYPPNPPYNAANPIDPTWEKALTFNGASDPTCAAWQGHNSPGGFGWLVHGPAPDCHVTIPADHWVEGDTGIGGGNDCGAKIESHVGSIVFLPVFDCSDGPAKVLPCQGNMPSGSNTWYYLDKLAAFYITAVDVTGQVKENLPGFPTAASKDACAAKGGKCIYGWFLTKTYAPGALIDPSGDPSGPSAVQFLG